MARVDLLRLIPGAPPALCDILDGAHGPLQPPIRSEIFGLQRFAQHGRSLGETHRAAAATRFAPTFFPRLKDNIRALRQAHRYIGAQAATGYDVSPAAEWLLDNFHLIEAQLKEIHEGLPRSYFCALPVLLDEPLAGLPRVYGVAWAFVAHTDGAFDEELLVQFLNAYQETRPLSLSEIWALPTTLRVVLVENLRRLAERVAANKAARAAANLLCDQIGSQSAQTLDPLMAQLQQRGVGQVFMAQMAQRLQDLGSTVGTGDAGGADGHHEWLARVLPDPASVQAQQRADQTADNLSVSNAVRSLRAIGDADWPELVTRTSALMKLMLGSQVFEAEDTTTRDQTLHAIEALARRSGRSEEVVAQTLLGLMQGANTDVAVAVAVASHWLHGPGCAVMASALGLHERIACHWRCAARQLALPVYLSAIWLGSFALVAWLLLHHSALASASGLPLWLTLASAALMLFPASEAVIAVINRLISESARPDHLPRLALPNGLQAEHRVMVVVPAMLTDHAATQALVHRLQQHHLANPERNTQFALLTDWVDADLARADSDQALLADAAQQVEALNQRHPLPPDQADPAAPAPRFILLHRERSFSQTEQRWIGWERKRGKLERLVAALAEGSSGAFIDLGDTSCIAARTHYILTLDSDTQLPPGRLRELVGVAAHPRNQPQLDASGRSVVSGYGILQPRIATPLPAPNDVTPYHALFAGQCGIDPYSAATSEVYQDLFGEGTFTGKGLLHVRAMHAVLSGRLPEGQVLSHDLIEGSMARCAAVTDITLLEDAPFHADVAASRVHRWTRGDWQLLPILLAPQRHRLRAVNCWKMTDNLRRSLVAPMSLALLVLSLATSMVAPWVALALVLAAFCAGPLLGAVAGLSPRGNDIAKGHYYRQAGFDLARVLWCGLWHLAMLLQHAMQAADAIVRSIWRMTISHRQLLQWTTAATAQAQAQISLTALLRRHRREPVLALALLAALWLCTSPLKPLPWLALPLCLLWAASPVWTWWVSRPRKACVDALLPPQDQAYLQDVARDSWRLFERCVGPEDNHLPPDNLQTDPFDMVAHRTSPTNIGLYLLSVACARQFGWIDTAELLRRIEATLDTLDTLQRHRGHFLNWYDTTNRAPLLPMYVSTVDSGNLSGHLLALAQACLELAEAPTPSPDESAQRLRALAQRCEQIAWQADFTFLYHRRRRLFHIGYRVAEQQLDAGFYDLLASESRLTSLLAIAKGDVPVAHWAALGRPFYAVGAETALRSWSGSMFEYLMPTLVLAEPHGSVLRNACHAAIREQIEFAAAHAVPWGVSESAYAGRDHTLAYQYAPQGVPRLALRRTPPDELVIAPYATALAAQLEPQRACRNFAALEALGSRGGCGFIEALDFTASRQSGGPSGAERCTPVATFMAHHQGMSIVAIANVLLDGAPQRWGMANAHIEAVASLLHEHAPREVSVLFAPPSAPAPLNQQRPAPALLREVLPGAAALEPTHVLGNGRYSVTLRANGAGASRWGGIGITRWRDDALRDEHGSFFYLRGLESMAQPGRLIERLTGDMAGPPQAVTRRAQQLVSLTQHPAPDPAAQYRSVYHADRVCFEAEWPRLHVHTTVWVSPEDDIEFRKIELRNLSDRVLEIELISAFDITLAEPRADEAHPAFGNLFVSAQWLPAQQALVFERRPRLDNEQALQAAHFIASSDPQVVSVCIQTDRQRWLGRNHAASRPLASFDEVPAPTGYESNGAAAPQAHTLDTGLDPVCAFAVSLRIAPHAKARLTFATAASDNGGTLRSVIDKYRQPSHVQRASLMSATLTGIRLRALGISAENFAAVQSLTTALVQTLTRPRAAATSHDSATGVVCDRRLLWRFGISGDRPLILVSAGVPQGLGLLRSLAQALRLWAWGGIACDLVVINAEPASYLMALQPELVGLRERHAADSAALGGSPSTGLHVLRTLELTSDDISTLQCLARVRLLADGRPLLHHVQEWLALHEQAFDQRHTTSTTEVALAAGGRGTTRIVAAPIGEFTPTGDGFHFDVSARLRPARPWINVLSNPAFGCQLTEAGGGYTWAVNSRMNQLTAWSNDPVADPPGEWFLLQDRKSLQVWSVAPSAWGDDGIDYHVAHGQGSSRISHRRGDLDVTATWCVDARTSVKQVRVRLVNRGHRTLHLRLIGMAEWMMGANRADRGSVHTRACHQRLERLKAPGTDTDAVRERGLTALLCTQLERAGGFGGGTAFLALAGDADEGDEPDSSVGSNGTGGTNDWTCDRRECFDARGRVVLPDHYGQRSGSGLDPCAALSIRLSLSPGASSERVFLLGYGDSPDAARQLATLAAGKPAAQRQDEVREQWDRLLDATTVKTPDPLFDAMVNRWLLYQTVTCRLWAKAGFYQAGGATGFRDQLQDAMALAWAAPATLREQIVVCAARQFAEGDVQHWWHAPGGAGVRTHFSDDLLWLPHACVHYLRSTGDSGLLNQQVAFLEGASIPEGAEDVYDTPRIGEQTASIYEHAARTIDRSLRVGVHGLPLMGSGDWNDGMNRVGHEGRGESVWLAWFLCQLVADFTPVARGRGEAERAQRWEAAAAGWKTALLGPAWDGDWFKRAFFDDGQPLGSHANAEARIDLIAQAWAVISNVAPPDLQRQALHAIDERLVDAQAGLIRLLDPPLAHAVPSAGYIQAYPGGVRENGGQYSHAGVWALMAQVQAARWLHGSSDRNDTAWRYFTWLCPAHRSSHPTQGPAYRIEPYVMAGDVYTRAPYVGRGGWSWYTGSAAWMHRAAIESIFGLRLGAQELSFTPCLPSHWPQAELTLRRDGRTLRFVFQRALASVVRDGRAVPGARSLCSGEVLDWSALAGEHCFVIELAQASEPAPPNELATLEP